MFLTKASGEFAIVIDGKIKDDATYVEYPEIRIGDRTFRRVKVSESLNQYVKQGLGKHKATFGLVNQRRAAWIVFVFYFLSIKTLLDVNTGFFIFGTFIYAGMLILVLRQPRWRLKWINVDGDEIHRE
jgi:hypothetical protein